MNRDTVLALNAINRAFYRTEARRFSATRRGPWQGFARALRAIERVLPGDGTGSVLDVGCGNGRFADALERGLGRSFAYLGVDASEELLAEAGARAAVRTGLRFVAHDFVAHPLEPALAAGHFDAILLLGVLHHVPGAATRRRLLAECARRLTPGGVLVLTLWRFDRLPRLAGRSVPWERLAARGGPPLDPEELEPGDHLLPFGPGEKALRYCHAFADEEAEALLAGLPLARYDAWLADGESGDLNRWSVWRPRR